MGALASTALTIADWAKRLDPTGKVPTIVELLSQTNEMLEHMRWIESNGPTSHQTTVRTGLPTVAWRLLNKGVAKSKSRTAQVTEAIGILEGRAEVDVDLAKLNGNTDAFRTSEQISFTEAMNQEMQQTVIYGNSSVSPEEFTGLAVRYSSLSAENARNVLSAGGSGSDNTSIWLVVWHENGVVGLFPKGSTAGLTHQDLGEQDAFDSDNNRFRALMDRWQWKAGVSVKDWRQAARICNIDVSALADEASAADLVKLMIKATHRIQFLKMGKACWYMNRTVAQYLDIQRRDGVMAGGGLTYDNVDGMPKYSFRGIPVGIVDALTETEAAVS
jgi:hypothetical protein